MLSGIAVSVAQAGHGDKDHREKRVVVEKAPGQGAFLGIMMQELDEGVREGLDTTAKRGVIVTEVIDESPAAQAGIQDGDVIVEFEGKKVDSPEELRKLIADQGVGEKVSVKLVRGKESKTVELTLGDWADQPAMAWMQDNDDDAMAPWHALRHYATAMVWPGRLGVRISELNEDLGSYFGVKAGEGVLVLDIEEKSTAEAVGLKAGDVIVKVKGTEVKSARDIREGLEDADPGDEIAVTVVRNKKTVELKGEMKEGEGVMWRGDAPGMRSLFIPGDSDNDDLRRELDELRKEIDELKKELKKS